MKFRLTVALTFLGIAGSFILLDFPISLWVALTAFVIGSIIISYGIVTLKSGFFYPAVSQTRDGKVLLTFDDGPDPLRTPRVLTILEKHRIKGVFFLIGTKVHSHPEIVTEILKRGHLIGNHTFSHDLFFAMKSEPTVSNEIDRWDELIEQQFGMSTNLFRPPVGYLNPIIVRVLRKRQKRVVAWSLRSFDTVFKGEKLLDRLMSQLRPGQIILFHDSLDSSLEILPEFLQRAEREGFKFVTDPEQSL